MPAPENAITTSEVIDGLNINMVQNFDQGMSPLLELLNLLDEVEVIAADTAIKQYKIVGELNETQAAEGEEASLSNYKLEPVVIESLTMYRDRKLTTGQAVLKSGFTKSVIKTDNKMINQVRVARLNEFYRYLANGTTKTSGRTLQAALIYADTALKAKMSKNGDASERVLHFVNLFDSADYLAEKEITTQTLSGMEYLEKFLGVTDVFFTANVPQGVVYATPVENLHIYGMDFDELDKAGLHYETTDNGLIGVAHEPNLARTSVETHVISGMLLIPEVLDYIAVAAIGDSSEPVVNSLDGFEVEDVDTDDLSDISTAFDPAGDVMPTMNNTSAEIVNFAEAHGIDLKGATNKTQQLEKIAAAMNN